MKEDDSLRAINARRNGAKSRGPKTGEGKAKSSKNALKHGLAADKWLHVTEDERIACEQFIEGIVRDLNPVGAVQERLVGRIVHCLWRLRKISALEAELIEVDGSDDSGEIRFTRPDWPQAFLSIARYESQLNHSLCKSLEELRELQNEGGSRNEPKVGASEAVEMALAALSRLARQTGGSENSGDLGQVRSPKTHLN